jgi:EmrB/QacA subfamily drug resistance transporter
LSQKRIIVITIGIMAGLFMASIEATVIATAMPTIVTQLGGLEIYSWAFSAYMLASTTTVPIFGKLSDLYGRRGVYMVAMVLFLVGSILCGQAQSMGELIVFRAVQGLGAGGLMPLAMTMIGDMFNFQQRAKMQGVFASIWGVSSVIGPLLGGFLVDVVSWPWVFYVNVPPGIVATFIIWYAWSDPVRDPAAPKVSVDYAGAALLAAGVTSLLIGLFEIGTPRGWFLLALAAALLIALIWVERRAVEPILPLALFRDRVFATACLHGVLVGAAMFGSISFVPLYVQSVLGTSATAAGAMLTPLIIAWVIGSIIGARLLLYVGYRLLILAGTAGLVVGSFFVAQMSGEVSWLRLALYLSLMGSGMGFAIPAFLIAVQSAVRRRHLGTATSTLQFSRSMGGAVGVSVMGAVLSVSLATNLAAAGLDTTILSPQVLMEQVSGETVAAGLEVGPVVQQALAAAVQNVFVVAFVTAVLAMAVSFLTPGGRIEQLEAERNAQEQAAAPRPVEKKNPAPIASPLAPRRGFFKRRQ